jgi:hypothetical protein
MIITQSETINFPPFHPNSKFPPIPPDKNKKIYQKFPSVSPIPLQTSAPSPAETPPKQFGRWAGQPAGVG